MGVGVGLFGVSMKSGLEDRNNAVLDAVDGVTPSQGLNEVRPGRPEQLNIDALKAHIKGLSQ